jgi:hypothetical protein
MINEEGPKEVAEPCRDRPDFGRVLCSLPMGHVQSETDWHQGKVTVTTLEEGSFHTKHETTEVIIRWAPKAEPED